MKTITIEIPLPHPGVTPNQQEHSGKRFSLNKKAREIGFCCAFAALNRADAPRWKKATASVVRYGKVARDCDRDNMISSLKHQIDGVCDAGIIENDKGLLWGEVRFDVDRDNPRVEIVIREATQ